jgi:demethylmenaquinone methyltransferase/2-methoxy-6-polyprenyl-1,4-benzoquinol methylase/phosphoethanolamine N-methyltransferase
MKTVEGWLPPTHTVEGAMGAWAPYYDRIMKLMFLGRERALREMTVRLVSLGPGDKVLEVGCGTGTLALMAKQHAGSEGEVVGIDASPEALDIARDKAAQAGMSVTFQHALMEDIPYPDDQFDVVLSCFMLDHLPDDDARCQGLAEVYRVLKPGGRLLIMNSESSNRKLPEMLGEAGFTDVEVARRWLILSSVRGIATKPEV